VCSALRKLRKKNVSPRRASVVHAVPMRKLLLVQRFAVRARWPLFQARRAAAITSSASRDSELAAGGGGAAAAAVLFSLLRAEHMPCYHNRVH
jgi:hypothetical protein